MSFARFVFVFLVGIFGAKIYQWGYSTDILIFHLVGLLLIVVALISGAKGIIKGNKTSISNEN